MEIKKHPKKKTNHILLYADFGCTTGFGNVAKELVDNWQKKLNDNTKLVIFSINDHHPEPYDYGNAMVVPGHTQALPDNKDGLYRLAFLNFIAANDFNVIMFINDLEVMRTIVPAMKDINKEKKKNGALISKTIMYFPIDSYPRKSDVDILPFFDEIITYTDYAKNCVLELTESYKVIKNIKVIPHGLNQEKFFPYSDIQKQVAKEELFGKDKFVIGSVNRNSPRKDVATTILAFSYFKHQTNAQNAVLYLHMNPLDTEGLNIPNYCERLGLKIGRDVIIPENFSENKGVSENDLNKLYNSFDVFITTSTAEGWGLTVTEALATKCLSIVPMHTSLSEITQNGLSCFPLRCLEPITFINDMEKVRFKSTIDEIVKTLQFIYHYPMPENKTEATALSQKTDAGYKYIQNLNWESISADFWWKIKKYFK